MKNRSILAGLLLMVGSTVALMAQLDRGTISGRVADKTGAVVPGVEVHLTNLATGVVTEAVTNDQGLYTLSNVPGGRYRISFSLPGFKTFEQSGINVSVAQMIRLDVTLEVGELAETVTVTADAALMNTETPLVGTTLQSEVVTDLPLSFFGGRAVENFAYAVMPSVEGDNWTSYIAGGPAFTKEVLIDGISATSQIQGHIGESSPTMEAVQEFKVQTSGMSAEYGRTSGGVFNFSLKSGTNDLHGSAFYYGRNEALNANTWMNNWRLSQSPDDPRFKRALDRQSLGGGSLGGPVVIPGLYDGRNRTFLFGAFEHYVQERLQLGEMNVTVPIPGFLDGDFSRLLTDEIVGTDALGRPVHAGQIFDPSTLRQVDGVWVADPFQGNIIPSDRISAVSARTADLFRQHYLPMVPDRLTQNSARVQHNAPWFHQTQLTMRGDHSFSPGNALTGSFIWTQRPRILVDQGGVWDPTDSNNTGGPFSRARKQEVTSRSARVSHNWTLRPNLMNTFSAAYNRYRNPSLATEADGDWANFLGLGGSTSAGHFPNISFGPAVNGVGTEQIGYSSAGYYVGNNYVLKNTVGWISGRHSLKFGGEFWVMQINSHAGIDTLNFGFSNLTTGIPGQPWSNRVGFGFASFLLGEVNNAGKNVPFDLYGRRKYVSLFVQDDFKATPRLTLNLGLRWEQTQPFREKHGQWANFNPNIENTQFGVMGALEFLSSPKDSFEREKDWKEFGPRAGFAYQLSDRLVLRGGYGIFFSPIGINYWSGVPYGFAPGFRGVNQWSGTGNLPRFNWDQGYPDNFISPTQDPNHLQWGMVAIDERSLFAGYTHQYNASLQWNFSQDSMVEFTYLGNDGRRLQNGALRRNQPFRSAFEDPNVDPFAWVWDAASAQQAGVPYPYAGWEGFAGMALQPFPHVAAVTWGPIYYVGSPLGTSDYRSFQISLTRRLNRGLAAQMSYNLSRARGNSETGFDETWDATGGVQDMHNLGPATTVTTFDQTHVFKGYVSYAMPFGRGQRHMGDAHPVLDAILGGWNVTTIFRYDTGHPLGISSSAWRPGWDGTVYADVAPGADLSKRFNGQGFNPGQQNDPGNLYFDPAAFSDPAGQSLGNGSRLYSQLRGFGRSSEDIGIMKYWHFGETASLQLRGELINAFNRHYFANPNTSLGNLSNFGHVTSKVGAGRSVQLGLRLTF